MNDRYKHLSRFAVPVVRVAVGLCLAVLLLHPGQIPRHSLDASWKQVLLYAFQNHLQFGRDIVITYGPLGWFYHFNYLGDSAALFYLHLGLSALLSLFVAALFMSVPLARLEKTVFLCLTILIMAKYRHRDDALIFLTVVGWTAVALFTPNLPAAVSRRLLSGALLCFLAALSLTKFTFFVLAVLAVFSMTAGLWPNLRYKALLIPPVYGIFLLTFWSASGQATVNFLPFLLHSLEMAGGYSEAMSLHSLPLLTVLAGVTMLLIFIQVLSMFSSIRECQALALGMFTLLTVFIAWKEGFVRQDAHIIVFFCFAALVPFFIHLDKNAANRRRLTFYFTRYAAVAVSVGVLAVGVPQPKDTYSPTVYLEAIQTTFMNNLGKLTLPNDAWENHKNTVTPLRIRHVLPKIRAMVGQSSVDVFYSEQGLAFLNDLNFTPRPVFQSYTAYTAKLLQLNAAFYLGPNAPEFVIYKQQPIDNHWPMLEDSLALLVLLRHYQPVLSERGYLLLKRMPGKRQLPLSLPVMSHQTQFGESVEVTPFNRQTLWLKLELQPSILGRLLALLYRFPMVYLEIEDSLGRQLRFRIVPHIAEAGFVLSPFFLEKTAVAAWFNGERLPAVKRFRVTIDPAWAGTWLVNRITVQVNTIELMPMEKVAKEPPVVRGGAEPHRMKM